MRQAGTRKRPNSAISTSDTGQVQQFGNQARNSSSPTMMENPSQLHMQSPQMPFNGVPDYTDPANIYATGFNAPPYYNGHPQRQPPGNLGNELVQAQSSNQMVPMPNFADGYPLARPDFRGPPPVSENELQGQTQAPYDDLDHRALLAQRDSQTKRKQIPPFIQKLSR